MGCDSLQETHPEDREILGRNRILTQLANVARRNHMEGKTMKVARPELTEVELQSPQMKLRSSSLRDSREYKS
jgi:hypothetical protein